MVPACRTALPALLAAIALTLGGCGSTSLLGSGHSASSSRASTRRAAHPAAASVAVIKHWARALQRGDVRAAARYFEIPSVFIDGPGPAITINSLADARRSTRRYPPGGATFISAAQAGPYVNVLFGLTGRSGPGGSDCASGAGQTARTDFIIKAGRITAWVRAPDQPGENPAIGSTGRRRLPGLTDGSALGFWDR